MLSREQTRFFDCNRMPWLSVLSGTMTLFLVYACGEVLYRIAIADASREEKLKARLEGRIDRRRGRRGSGLLHDDDAPLPLTSPQP